MRRCCFFEKAGFCKKRRMAPLFYIQYIDFMLTDNTICGTIGFAFTENTQHMDKESQII